VVVAGDPLRDAALILSLFGWSICAVGWWRVFTANDKDMRLQELRQTAFVMVGTCIVTAVAIGAVAF
jgi:hypothetical protein